MEHFQIIQALVRSALATGGPAVRNQVERLKDALNADGDKRQSQSITKLLANASKATEMVPSKITQSRALLIGGETLTKNTALPVDRETASPLADIYFPEEMNTSLPLLDGRVDIAAKALLAEWNNVEALYEYGVHPSKTCLLYGAPGTGKTTLASWMAVQLGIPMVVARLDGLISSFLGTTSRNVGALFSFANRYKCLLVLDEFDAVAKVRDDPNEVGEIKRVVNALLQNIDTRKNVGLTIAITNHEQLLDPAIWRRFEIQIKVPKPDNESRRRIIELYLKPLSLDERITKLLSWITKDFSGAEIEVFINAYKKYFAIHSVSDNDIFPALQYLAAISGDKIRPEAYNMIMQEPPQIATALAANQELNFSRIDIGALLSKDKTTIGRWIKAA